MSSSSRLKAFRDHVSQMGASVYFGSYDTTIRGEMRWAPLRYGEMGPTPLSPRLTHCVVSVDWASEMPPGREAEGVMTQQGVAFFAFSVRRPFWVTDVTQ